MRTVTKTLKIGDVLSFDKPVKSVFIETRRSESIRNGAEGITSHYGAFNPEALILDCDQFELNFRQAYRYFTLLDGGDVDGRLFRECLNANIQWLELTNDDRGVNGTSNRLVYGFDIKFPYPVTNLVLRDHSFDKIGDVTVLVEYADFVENWSVCKYDVRELGCDVTLRGNMRSLCVINMNEWILRKGYSNLDFKTNISAVTIDGGTELVTRLLFRQHSLQFIGSQVYHFNAFNFGDCNDFFIRFYGRELGCEPYNSIGNDYQIFWIEK